jgi:hypothetical protein
MTGPRRQAQNPSQSHAARAEQLAASLRANMKRRKAQARARAQAKPHDSAGIVPAGDPGRPKS